MNSTYTITEGNDALNRALLMMRYDLSKTLKENIVSEQDTAFTLQLDKDYSTPEGATKRNKEMRELLSNHDVNTVLMIATAFIPVVGPLISTGIALGDAAVYYNEGDKKSAGLMAMFALLPGIGSVVSKIPGIKQLGVKGMGALASKLSKGVKITNPNEINIVKSITKNRQLIQKELDNTAKNLTIRGAKNIAKKKLKQQAIKQTVKSTAGNVAKTTAGYMGAGLAYNKLYDKFTEPDLNRINKAIRSPEVSKLYSDELILQPDGTWDTKD